MDNLLNSNLKSPVGSLTALLHLALSDNEKSMIFKVHHMFGEFNVQYNKQKERSQTTLLYIRHKSVLILFLEDL